MTGPGTRLAEASVRLDSIPPTGRDVEIPTTGDERAAVAARLGITSVDALAAKLHAVHFRGGIRVTGRLSASVTQQSVVSLEPVKQEISEPIDRIFLPGAAADFAGAAGAEVFVDLEGDDVPDHFDGQEADLSELVVETLALAVDLYPRAEGDTLALVEADPDLADDSPFAALRSLKDKP